MNSSQNYTFKYREEDIKKNKSISFLAYIPLLFVFPLLKKDSEFAKFHANQGLVLFIFEVISGALYLLLKWIAEAFTLTPLLIGLNFVLTVVLITLLSVLVSGIINVSSGLAKSLPFIGGIEIIK